MGLTIIGVVVDPAFASALTRLFDSFLFGVKAHDPRVFIAVPILLSVVALAAVINGRPALREARRAAARAISIAASS